MEMVEITLGFNNMRAGKFHFDDNSVFCTCGCDNVCANILPGTETQGAVSCQARHHRYRRSTHLWEQSLCARLPGSDWHALKCIMGECSECGFDLIPLCEREVDPENTKELEWRRFENVAAGKTKLGDPKKVVRLEYKLTTARMFLQYAARIIPEFVRHQHTARWQDSQFKESLRKLQPGEVFSLIDFAENYSFKGQDEIQSMHWYNFQITILVHIMYRVNDHFNPQDPKSKRLKTDYFYYVSDDPKHDSLFVQFCLNLHWTMLSAWGKAPNRHIVWSDGCAAQFKGATAWYYVARYELVGFQLVVS